jgi:tRNA pseudouridine38-40 synthase
MSIVFRPQSHIIYYFRLVPRFFLRLSFNGANYHGWQIQANAHSVQEEINSALRALLKHEVETAGCGRTDAGVHARIFFAHFETDNTIESKKDFLHHLNCIVSKDIAVQDLIEVDSSQHARFAATSRSYKYYLHQKKNPFLNESSHFFPFALDMEKMNHAAKALLGPNDFSSFSKTRTQVRHFNCHITEAVWKTDEQWGQLVFHISADRFLRTMVRTIVGTLLEVGEGKTTVEDFQTIIDGKSRRQAGIAVPPHGLYLTEVKYPFL